MHCAICSLRCPIAGWSCLSARRDRHICPECEGLGDERTSSCPTEHDHQNTNERRVEGRADSERGQQVEKATRMSCTASL